MLLQFTRLGKLMQITGLKNSESYNHKSPSQEYLLPEGTPGNSLAHQLDLDISIFVLPVALCGRNICLPTPIQGSHYRKTHSDGYPDAPSPEVAHLPP